MTTVHYENNNDDRLFIAESNIIASLAKNKSFVIVGRCADYILRDNKDVVKVFLYSDMDNKVKRATNYYGIDSKNAERIINKINKEREKHYNYYTNRKWKDYNNYDLVINVDKFGVVKCAEKIKDFISN